jgi:hypothetical protein
MIFKSLIKFECCVSEIVNLLVGNITNIFLLLQQLCADLMYLHCSCGADGVVAHDALVRCAVAVVQVGATIYLTLEQLHYTTAVVLLWSSCDATCCNYGVPWRSYTVRPLWCLYGAPVMKLRLSLVQQWGSYTAVVVQLYCTVSVMQL